MTIVEEAARSLRGALRLALFDPGGFDDLNVTIDGFWHSFLAIVGVAPLYLYATKYRALMPDSDSDAGRGYHPIPALLLLVVGWIVWALLAAVLSKGLGLSRSYARYMIADNWASVIFAAASCIPLFLWQLGLSGSGLVTTLSLAVGLVSLVCLGFIAAKAHGINAWKAALFPVANLLTVTLIGYVVSFFVSSPP